MPLWYVLGLLVLLMEFVLFLYPLTRFRYLIFICKVESSSREVHFFDFHIVYSATYRVPVLYFRAYSIGMQIPLQFTITIRI